MTREEVFSLSDENVAGELAKQLMGWRYDIQIGAWVDYSGEPKWNEPSWHPFRAGKAWFAVLGAARRRFGCIQIRDGDEDEDWLIEIFTDKGTPSHWRQMAEYQGSLCLGTCRAILLAMEKETRNDA